MGLKSLSNATMDEQKEGWKEYEGKKVFIKLINGREYSGEVYAVEVKSGISLIKIKDRYGGKVAFYDTEISVIEEEGQR